LSRIANDRSWTQEEIAVLHSCTERDLVDWIDSRPADLSNKIRNGLLLFGRLSGDARYAEIAEKARSVLRAKARESDINRIRVENMYQVQLQDVPESTNESLDDDLK
jgi:hypothetical protein